MAQLVVEHLSKSFCVPGGQVVALENVSFTVGPRELLVLVGPSGCGKTTCLRLIAGLEQPDSGVVRFDARVMNNVAPGLRDVAMVFQNPALYPHMTVYENLAFGLRVRHCSRAEIEERVNSAAELLDLRGCLGRSPADLSGGQRQRVALGRALVRRPALLLLDEPLSNLDAPTRAQLRMELLQHQHRLGVPMVYVTHDQAEALSLGDRAAVLNAGKLQQIGEPSVLFHNPANRFVATFIGEPAINFFRGSLVARGENRFFETEAGSGQPQFVLTVPSSMLPPGSAHKSEPVLLGIRPQHIRLAGSGVELNSIHARIELIRSAPPDVYVHAAAGAVKFTARAMAADPLATSSEVAFVFDIQHAVFFHPVTGEALYCRPCAC